MSYFSEDSQQPQEPQTEDYVSTIVQEKGEQWKDPPVFTGIGHNGLVYEK